MTVSDPAELGLHPERWQNVLGEIQKYCDNDVVPAAGLCVARHGVSSGTHLFGRQALADQSPTIRDDAIFLIASITKPIVAMGVMRLVEQGQLLLSDKLKEYIPEFGNNAKSGITIRHLLTHTSGLPDMLMNNRELRANCAPLSEFVAGTIGVKPYFPPGRGMQYQSMGFAMLGELIHRVTGLTCSQFLKQEFFDPLGMNDTELGAPNEWFEGPTPKIHRIAEIRLPRQQLGADDWGWNSRYWRRLGVPWGGVLSTPSDLARFAQMMLDGGRAGDQQILSAATVNASTKNQLMQMPEVPETDRRCRPWGFGWRLHWPAHSANFGDLLGPRTYGHWGATGTVLWVDPDLNLLAVFLTTQPLEPHGKYLARVSNLIAAAVVE